MSAPSARVARNMQGTWLVPNLFREKGRVGGRKTASILSNVCQSHSHDNMLTLDTIDATTVKTRQFQQFPHW